MRVAVDLEDVLVDCNSRFIERLNFFIEKRFPGSGLEFQRSDISGWAYDGVREPFSELMGWETDQVRKFMYGHGDWKGYIPITEEIWREETGSIPWIDENLEKNIQLLREKVKTENGQLHLVTARRRCDNSIKQKLGEKHLERYFDKIVIESEKHELDYDFYIDDNPGLYPKLESGKVQLVRIQPWNRDKQVQTPHRKIGSISESVEVIQDLD
ncbi:MAG: hypothetical protein ABEJ95_07110 [Candidatus Nanohalobium sp.]